jgi:hypothetical protein
VREFVQLLVRKARGGPVALGRVAFTQERVEFVSMSVSQYDQGADKVGAIIGSAGLRSVARDAFRNVGCFTSIRGGGIDGLFVARTGTRRCLSA